MKNEVQLIRGLTEVTRQGKIPNPEGKKINKNNKTKRVIRGLLGL